MTPKKFKDIVISLSSEYVAMILEEEQINLQERCYDTNASLRQWLEDYSYFIESKIEEAKAAEGREDAKN